MRYFGSKTSTVEIVYDLISKRIPTGTFCDPFGGIGTVGSYFQSKAYNVWSGDILTFPHYFQISKIKFDYSSSFINLISELGLRKFKDIIYYINSISPEKGWFTREYSEKRKFFTISNAQKIQACREKIISWSQKGWINHDEHAVLLASLINSMDKVANTAGTYYAYLKKWHRKALKEFQFEFIPQTVSDIKGYCFKEPASSFVKRQHFDILYLDPPYNSRSYAHYYHLPETIALEVSPEVRGKSGVPINISSHSEYNSYKEASYALNDLLNSACFNLLVFHYADNGIIPEQKVRTILSSIGYVEDYVIEAKGYTTIKTSNKIKHHLYLVQNA